MRGSPEEAIYEACLLRFRPIMMTTMAALLGALPLALGSGVGSELRRPLGISIVGGLIFSQMLTLYTTPVIYLYLDRFRLWVNRLRHQARWSPEECPLLAGEEGLRFENCKVTADFEEPIMLLHLRTVFGAGRTAAPYPGGGGRDSAAVCRLFGGSGLRQAAHRGTRGVQRECRLEGGPAPGRAAPGKVVGGL